jgi:tRNA nucleotidyltransferase (CCA-adding enzyme)
LKIYLVGGAVRDELLGRPVTERDWVVVGSTPDEMRRLGFKAVGKDFPVFLHPDTHEEYALARTERKIAKGYKGFEFHTDPSVSLVQDLLRRDLTINAIAKDGDTLTDPYGGVNDLRNKMLRHVSSAFAEDPVRILRLARFSARFPDFSVHPDTITLMRSMVANGEVDALVPERVWKEWVRALGEKNPLRFFDALHACGALEKLFPEINLAKNGVKALAKAANNNEITEIRFAALFMDLTEKEALEINSRFKLPNEFKELALLVCKFFEDYVHILEKSPEEIFVYLKKTDAVRRPERFEHFLKACEIGSEILNLKSTQSEYLKKSLDALNSVSTKDLQAQNLKGADFAEALKEKQIAAIRTTMPG